VTTITITKEQEELIRMLGNGVKTASEAEYIFIPYWFRKNGDQWEVFPLDPIHLPIELREHITKQRLGK
jgi:hypothetical protein